MSSHYCIFSFKIKRDNKNLDVKENYTIVIPIIGTYLLLTTHQQKHLKNTVNYLNIKSANCRYLKPSNEKSNFFSKLFYTFMLIFQFSTIAWVPILHSRKS